MKRFDRLQIKDGRYVLVLRPMDAFYREIVARIDSNINKQEFLEELWEAGKRCKEYEIVGWWSVGGFVCDRFGKILHERKMEIGDTFTSEAILEQSEKVKR